jgi:hypothetical protein
MATTATMQVRQQLETLLFRASRLYQAQPRPEAANIVRLLLIWRYRKPFTPPPQPTLGGITYFLEQMERQARAATNNPV